MTLKDLFKKYKDLDNPKISGVEFYKFISDKDELDLKVISSLDEAPGELSVSGFEMGDEDRKVGNYLLAFPFSSNFLIFSLFLIKRSQSSSVIINHFLAVIFLFAY